MITEMGVPQIADVALTTSSKSASRGVSRMPVTPKGTKAIPFGAICNSAFTDPSLVFVEMSRTVHFYDPEAFWRKAAQIIMEPSLIAVLSLLEALACEFRNKAGRGPDR
jgi:hypothetical protein